MIAPSRIAPQLLLIESVTICRAGPPGPSGKYVVYGMQRSQRALDHPALETAVRAGQQGPKNSVIPCLLKVTLQARPSVLESVRNSNCENRKTRIGGPDEGPNNDCINAADSWFCFC